MKTLLGFALAAFYSLSFAATTTPVQLLNPTGSSAGQAIVSTGSSTAPAWGGVGLNGISAIASNRVVGNATASTASPTALVMPSCSTSASALNWTTSSGFTCNTAVNAATLGGATFAAPGAIGGTTPSTGVFTTLSAISNDAMFYTNTSAQSIPNNTATTVTNWTQVFARNSANFNTTTGVFTAPATGIYLISAQLAWNPASVAVGSLFRTGIVANGTLISYGITTNQTTTAGPVFSQSTAVVALNSGQTVVIQGLQNSGASAPLLNSANTVYLSIARLP